MRKSEEKKATTTVTRPLTQKTLEGTHPYKSSGDKAIGITRAVMEMICLDNEPFTVVEKPGFQRLVAKLDPRYVLPGRKYFADVALPELHQDVYKYTERLLEEDTTTEISFTTDLWSSQVSPMAFLSLTAQWVDEDFKLQKVILHAQECPGSHTAENLKMAFLKMLQAWNIPKERVHALLRDNARNMAKAMEEAQLPSLPCFAHTLQLAINDSILSQRTIKDILAIGRRLVGHFKHSTLAYGRLKDVQLELAMVPKRLQQDVPTRWNSSYYMLQSLREQKRALSAYVADYELPATFTANQWGLIDNLLSILEPFEELTRENSKSCASAADVIPVSISVI